VSRRARLGLFALAGPGLAAVLVLGFRGLPPFGGYRGVYGFIVNGVELGERHATDYVTALNFDLRAFDTLGEEYILFAAVLGVTFLLSGVRERKLGPRDSVTRPHQLAGASDAIRAVLIMLVPLVVALGGYVVLHGALTPGGGFQGGVVLASGPLCLLIAGRFLAMRRLAPDSALEALDAIGAGAYAALGLAGLVLASIYLRNFLPLGISGHLLSGGYMPLNSLAVGLEVTGGFLVVWTQFLDQTLLARRRGTAGR
jgi:multicomponent Na+:H+ antiporter subunit B